MVELYYFDHLGILYLYEDHRLYFYGYNESDWIPSAYISIEQCKGRVGNFILLFRFEE